MNGGTVIIAAGALATSAWLTGRLCSVTSWAQPVDRPNERSLHTRPTPRTGGLAIWGGLTVGLVGSVLLNLAGLRTWPVDWSVQAEGGGWIAGMVVFVGIVSFLDDYKGVPAGIRLAVHTLAASVVVVGAGLVVPAVVIPTVGTIPLGWLAVPLTVLFIVWMVNLYNFMDGMDGLAGGMTWLGFGFLSIIGWIGGHTLIFLPSLMISMAAAGFLFYNRPPARIFMGDVGSVPIGFLAASLAVLGVRDGAFDIWVPLLIFSPFIIDATVTMLRRMLRGQQFWRAHREHYYQRLVLAGWGHRNTMLAEYTLMLVSGLTALLYVSGAEPIRLALLSLWIIGYIILSRGVQTAELKSVNQGTGA